MSLNSPAITPSVTTAPVKSAWLSKINWAQALATGSMLLAAFGINMDDATRAHALEVITGGQALVTWVLRTFFTTTITPSSLPTK